MKCKLCKKKENIDLLKQYDGICIFCNYKLLNKNWPSIKSLIKDHFELLKNIYEGKYEGSLIFNELKEDLKK